MVKIRDKALDTINSLSQKSRRIIKTALEGLAENPFPGTGGDKEKIVLRGGRIIYRLHISHFYTVYYSIDQENNVVKVQDIFSIEQAHKKYGYY